jgi:hypothetical protein
MKSSDVYKCHPGLQIFPEEAKFADVISPIIKHAPISAEVCRKK